MNRTSLIFALLFANFSFLTLPGQARADLRPVGGRFILDDEPDSQEEDPDLCGLANGRLVAVWRSPAAPGSQALEARVYGADGTPDGAPFTVFQTSDSSLLPTPSICCPRTGGFAVAWAAPSGGLFGHYSIQVRRYDSAGSALGPATEVTGPEHANLGPEIACHDNGYAVAWSENDNGADRRLLARQLDRNGAPVTPVIEVNDTPFGGQLPWGMAARDDGAFLAVWSGNYEGSLSGRLISAAGVPAGPSALIEPPSDSGAGYSEIASVDVARSVQGKFLVAWTEQDLSFGRPLSARLVSSAGTPEGDALRLVPPAGQAQGVVAAADASGRFALAWRNVSNNTLLGQLLTPAGAPAGGGPSLLSAEGQWSAPFALAAKGAGDFVLVWNAISEEGFPEPHGQVIRADGGTGTPAPPYPWIRSSQLLGFEVQARITAGATPVQARAEADCIAGTVCLSGNLPGRPELFIKVIGPRPNGYLWVQISRFTPSEVEVWIRQIATGKINYYRLRPLAADDTEVPGLQDRTAFLP
jgi:hypothetical protein